MSRRKSRYIKQQKENNKKILHDQLKNIDRKIKDYETIEPIEDHEKIISISIQELKCMLKWFCINTDLLNVEDEDLYNLMVNKYGYLF